MVEKMLQEDENEPCVNEDKPGTNGMPAAAVQEQEEQAVDQRHISEDGEDVENLRRQLETEKEAVAEHLERARRAQAEMENLRKRVTRDIENAHKYALERFVKELLPVVDSLELGMSVSKGAESIDELCEGMTLTLKKFIDVMAKFSVDVIDPVGEKFTPDLHEAVSMEEVEGQDAGLVTTVMQKGYQLNGRLIRPAMVVVTK